MDYAEGIWRNERTKPPSSSTLSIPHTQRITQLRVADPLHPERRGGGRCGEAGG